MVYMNRFFLVSIFFLITLTISCTRQGIKIQSPSKKLEVKIAVEESGLKLNLFDSNKPVINADLGKFVFNNDVLGNGYEISKAKQTSKDEEWKPVYGERSLVHNKYNEVEITLKDKDASDKTIQLVCRVYDEGIAFRYIFDKKSIGDVVLKKELTAFNFDGDYNAWTTDRAQGVYKKEKLSKIDFVCERPLVISRNDTSFLALGEAALVDYAQMKFKKNP